MAQLPAEQQARFGQADLRLRGDGLHARRGNPIEAVERDQHPLRVALVELSVGRSLVARRSRASRSSRSGSCSGGDAELGTGPARGAQHVAQRHLLSAAWQRTLTSSGASPLPRISAPERIASIGCTCTARQTGYTVAATGSSTPSAAAWTKTPALKGVFITGSGRKSASSRPIATLISQPSSSPNTTPSSAICAPTSTGRRASRARGTPSAIPIPIWRRCASTIRVARLTCRRPAPAKTGTQSGKNGSSLFGRHTRAFMAGSSAGA